MFSSAQIEFEHPVTWIFFKVPCLLWMYMYIIVLLPVRKEHWYVSFVLYNYFVLNCFSISLVQWHLSMYCIQYGLHCLHTYLNFHWVKSFLKGTQMHINKNATSETISSQCDAQYIPHQSSSRIITPDFLPWTLQISRSLSTGNGTSSAVMAMISPTSGNSFRGIDNKTVS